MKYAWPIALALLACASPPRALPTHFTNGDVRLAFTLDLPAGQGPFPAVVMGHGSGRVTRDQLTWAARRFTALGYAVLRFDKRGVGESTGLFVFVGTKDSPWVFPQLASDVAAGVRFLRDGRRSIATASACSARVRPAGSCRSRRASSAVWPS
jgi:pimeloyl-ACP methyl ester carboxylesterase